MRTGLARAIAGSAIVLLCGATVAMAGPIAFAGLIVPHLARWAAGPDMRWTLAFSAVFGPLLLVPPIWPDACRCSAAICRRA
ncbi:iron chelate uptake ABC transporter family permease subunit (plasmid) [Leisingera aquaemixtae]|uniref:iron chelate uptake ABC transporter family permease subunit n=1 Tax=Leisingera aquaemixtae TaxID=1396826 RepID=UPI00398430ED